MFLRFGSKHFKIDIESVLYVKAEKRYTSVVTERTSHPASIAISDLEKILPCSLFCKIHRSFIVSLKYIDEFDNDFVYIGKNKIPISEHYRTVLKNSITIINGKNGHPPS